MRLALFLFARLHGYNGLSALPVRLWQYVLHDLQGSYDHDDSSSENINGKAA